MKTPGLLIAVFFIVQAINQAGAVPIRLIGQLRVVDELGREIKNAEVWLYSGPTDSSRLMMNTPEPVQDSVQQSFFPVYHSGWRFLSNIYKAWGLFYSIRAEGYQQVILKNLQFRYISGQETSVLVITLYSHAWLKNQDQTFSVSFCVKALKVKSSRTLRREDYGTC